MRVKRLAATAAAGVVLLGAGGCSGDDTAAVAGDAASTSSSASSSAPAEEPAEPAEAETSVGEDPEAQPGGYDAEELLAAMKAAVEEHQSTHMVMDISGGGGQTMTGEGDVSYEGDTTSMQMVMEAAQLGRIEMRLVDNVMYMAMPPMTQPGKFLEFDLDDPANPMGDLGGITQGDPLQTFEAFDKGLEKVEYVGREDVDGEEMDHYVLTVDGKAAAQAQGNRAGGQQPETLTYDLWLDDHDLMRRVQYTMADGGVTITMSDWGKPVTVKAPAPGAIMQMPGQ